MLRNSLLILMILVLAIPAVAGDPLDTNDGPSVTLATGFDTPGCDNAEKYPGCGPCWTTCLYALMADAWSNGGWDNDLW